MVTKVAMTTMNDGILTLSGIRFLISEITRFDITSTKVVASPIPSPLMADEGTPRVGHIPSHSPTTGFSLINPLVKFIPWFIVHSPSLFCVAEVVPSYRASSTAKPLLMASRNALDDIVAAVIASISPPSFDTENFVS